MTDQELYTLIINDPVASKYVDNMKLNLLYKYLQNTLDGSVSMAQLVSFLQEAEIDPFQDGVVPSALFRGDQNIKNFDFSNIKEVSDMAFYESGIKSANLVNVKSVGSFAFNNTPLQELKLSGVEAIGDYAFSRCKNLTELYIPDSCNKIGDYAFGGCRNLEVAVVDFSTVDKRRALSDSIFASCVKLNEIYLHENTVLNERGFVYYIIKQLATTKGTLYVINDGLGSNPREIDYASKEALANITISVIDN